MPEAKTRIREHHLPLTLAMCAPAVRMVVVEAIANPDESGELAASHALHPVLALVASQAARFAKSYEGGRPPAAAATPEQLDRKGWDYDGLTPDRVGFDAVVWDRHFGVCEASFAFDGSNVAHRVLPCPWPAEEDEGRLSEAIAEVEAEAIEKARASGSASAEGPRDGDDQADDGGRPPHGFGTRI